MINLETDEKIIKERILDGDNIQLIKTDKTNKCVIIACDDFRKVCFVDY